MKTSSTRTLTLALGIAAGLATAPVYASGTHGGSHSSDKEQAIGMPGKAAEVSRTIAVEMRETDDGAMVFDPSVLEVTEGETVRFKLENAGELEHEFVLGSMKENRAHQKMMAEMPDMVHQEANAVRLASGEKGEVVWKFTTSGTFEAACLMPGHYELGMKSEVLVSGI